jgi:Fe-S-cluster containining protein
MQRGHAVHPRPPAMEPTQPARNCSYCGTCCRKGGPALHLEDRLLVEQGFIHTRHLYTIRSGEPVRDPVRGGLTHAESDIIKIKGRGGRWVCRFLDEDSNRCRIYAHRPLECRELACWNPSRIEKAYDRGRLSRRDLLAGIDGLWELIEDHERRCSYARIQEWRNGLSGPGAEKARVQLAEVQAYDLELRKLMVSRGRIEAGMLDFLLGRPVEQVLRAHRPAANGAARRKTAKGRVGL